MKEITIKDYLGAMVLMTPIIMSLAFVTYKLALEIWCMVYGLIY